jgi:hypothetical protein
VPQEGEPGAVLESEAFEQRAHDEEGDRHAPERGAADQADLVIGQDELLLELHQDVAHQREGGPGWNEGKANADEKAAPVHSKLRRGKVYPT